jgi:DNA primase
MFPICDEQGRVVGFSGRVLAGDEKTAKYVNSPETPIFTKSKVFFGLDKSKRAVLDAGYAIVCEGQLDFIACFMAGVQNIVAPQGTAFTADHARILKRYAEEVVLCFDSDSAGQNAAVRALDSLLASGLAVRVAVIPPPHDPDSFIQASGAAAFQQLIERAEGFFDFYLNRLCATNEVSSDKGRLAVLRDMGEAIHKTANGVLIDKYAQKTALRLGVSPDSVRTEFKKMSRGKVPSAGPDEPSEATAPVVQPPSAHEAWLLKLLLTNDELVEWAAHHLDVNWMEHARVRQVVSDRLAARADQTWTNLAAFLSGCETTEMQNLVAEAVSTDRPVPDPAQQLADVTLRLRNQFLDRQLAGLMVRINHPETVDAERENLLRQQQELRALKRRPLTQKGDA